MSEEQNDEQNFLQDQLKNASDIEKVAWGLILLSFFVGTFGLMGDFAIIGVLMAGAGTVIGIMKKNWPIVVVGAIDFFILLDYMNNIQSFYQNLLS